MLSKKLIIPLFCIILMSGVTSCSPSSKTNHPKQVEKTGHEPKKPVSTNPKELHTSHHTSSEGLIHVGPMNHLDHQVTKN